MNLWKYAKYRTKVITSFLLIIIIPMVAGLYFLYKSIVLFNENSVRQTLEQQLDQHVNSINGDMTDIDRASYLLSTNTTVCQFVADSLSTPVDLIHRLTSDILPMCSWFEASTHNIFDFAFYTDNNDIPETEIFHPIKKYRDETWFKAMTESLPSPGGLYWEGAHPYHTVQYRSNSLTVFTLYRQLLLPESGRTGYCAINVSAQRLFSGIVSQPLLGSGTMLVAGSDGTILSGRNPLEETGTYLSNVSKWPGNSVIQKYGGRNYQMISRAIEPIGVYLVAIIPQDTLYYMSSHSRLIFFVIAIGAVGLTVLLAVILSNGLISRINTMVGAVHQIQSGDFSVHINVQGNDEIDELVGNINLMSARINELINTVYRAETLQKETEIRALQAQINPHFLFNVLETFKMMAELNDDERLADGITSLGQLMRYNVSLSLKPTTLDAELQNLHSYINIQNLILNKRLHVDYDIPEECRSAHVPRLLLQPLVENSIKHGFSSITGNLLIHIKANLLENQLNITLSDNGTGMTGEELDVLCKKVYSPIGDDSSHGVGLWNVNQRLKLIFGRSELQFASNSPGNGFTVIIAIPQLIEGNTEQS